MNAGRKRVAKLMGALLVGLSLGVAHLSAQVVTARIVGVVGDPSGAAVPDARVVATNLATGVARETRTNPRGEYVFPDLPAGSYNIEASRSGFSKTTVEKVVLNVLQVASVDVELAIAAVAQNVTVTATSTILQTQTSDVGRVVTRTEIETLPLNGRDYLQLATLTPGVNTRRDPNVAFFLGSNFLGGTDNVGSAVQVGIDRPVATAYVIDRTKINNPLTAQSSYLPSLDSVQEFNVQTVGGSAAQESASSVNVITRGGTNELHGSIYEYLRNNALDGRNFFERNRVPLRYNNFGGSVGGPIVKNKTFFYGDYEAYRTKNSSTAFAIVPTQALRNGDFTGRATIFDPQTGQPFSNNIIPFDRIGPFAKAFNKFIPLPNFVGTGSLAPFNFSTTLAPFWDSDQGTVRIDHTFSPKDSIWGKFLKTSTDNKLPGIAPFFGMVFPYRNLNATMTETHSFSPALLNVFTASYLRSILLAAQEGVNGTVNPIPELGLKNLAGAVDPLTFGLPNVGVSDLGGFGPTWGFVPRGGTWNLFNFQDDLTYIKGSHTFQFGVSVERNQYNSFNPTAPRGSFSYIPFFTKGATGGGSAYADYLLDLPFSATGDSGSSLLAERWTRFQPYAQDDWRVTKTFTLNFGLRYLYDGPRGDKYNHESYFDFGCPCLVTAASGKIPNGIISRRYGNFAPRIGFAWTPRGGKTVVRGGYGIYYSPTLDVENLFLRNNPPTYTLYSIANFANVPPLHTTDFFPPPLAAPNQQSLTFTVDPRQKTTSDQEWTLAVERQFTSTLKLTVAYVGDKGTHLQRRINQNQAFFGTGPLQSRRPFPQFGDILQVYNGGNSTYHAIQLSAVKVMSHGVFLTAAYHFSNGLDDGTSTGDAGETRQNFRIEKGRADSLARQRLIFDVVYELPFGRGKPFLANAGKLDRLVGGWRVSSITLFQSGFPLTVTALDLKSTGAFTSSRANRLCNSNLPKGQRTLTRFFDTSCFVQPPLNSFGNSARGVMIGPGLNNWDINIAKDTRISENKLIRFEAQFFNAFNHPQFNNPSTSVASPLFGRVTSARTPRNIQFGLQFKF